MKTAPRRAREFEATPRGPSPKALGPAPPPPPPKLREPGGAPDGRRRPPWERLATRPAAPAPPAPSALPPPALGRLAARHGDPGPDGPRRGVALETAPYALVRAPALATLRHVGPLPGRGLAAALEPADGLLIVLSGLDRVDRAPGEILRAGEPLGAMGGPPPSAEEFLIDASRAEASIPTETIYIETWRDGAPADPETWFAFDSEGTSG
jgi:Membrane-bound metallopeptidase